MAPELLVLARKLVIVCDDRLAALNDYTEGLKGIFGEETEADVNDRKEHYSSLKDEALKCIAEIAGSWSS